jgi:hypothetical protein
MKKITSVLTTVALVTTSASLAFAGMGAGTGVNGSVHDINFLVTQGKSYKKDDFQRVCVFCHTPHNALPNGSVPAPLWNHEPSKLPTSLQPYIWAAPANTAITINTADPLVGPSRLCMACHDGLTAVDAHGSAGTDNNGNTTLKAALPGTTDPVLPGVTDKRYIDDLTITHPIGFKYADAVAARNRSGRPDEIVPATSYFLSDVPPDSTHNRTGGNSALKQISETLYGKDGWFTCASCHDVHNTNNVSSPAGKNVTPNYFLWATEKDSIICLSCHIK